MRRLPVSTMALLAAAALSACTSTQDVLEPSAIAAQQSGSATAGPQPATSSATTSTTDTAALGKPISANIRVQVAPIVGASVEAATPLTERLATKARERGIRLAGSSDQTATHVLKGYFSALTEGKETTVVYVWDVYDPAGTRLHRINGQQKVQISGGDGWSSVPPSAMQSIADATIDQLALWLSGQTG
ncbi:hypothetical protein [Pseudaminobacter soli (ex Li et al. 2025)]|uniref:Lipoprotein n=1 Tax=Pseudaminobacter soli (ex Li et al. 2025) TaxID=1295366 RepID=A0A2P7S743_9HYPH|nr:hypothetical protein [Mesorhizobium soli]PSJ58296.1 hypothetical protein C7I85_20000 [Mesorhizobium soli]